MERSQTSQVGSPYLPLAVSGKKTAEKKRYNENAFGKKVFVPARSTSPKDAFFKPAKVKISSYTEVAKEAMD